MAVIDAAIDAIEDHAQLRVVFRAESAKTETAWAYRRRRNFAGPAGSSRCGSGRAELGIAGRPAQIRAKSHVAVGAVG